MTIPDPSSHPEMVKPKEEKLAWCHEKTGHVYEILHGDDPAALREHDFTPMIIYQRIDEDTWERDGVVWVRTKKEFFDGRFKPVLLYK